MKEATSLEDEKRALLEQIHASRENYRRMLTKPDTRSRKLIGGATTSTYQPQHFPRSMTMRWLVGHPYLSMAAVATMAAATMLGTRTAKKAVTYRKDRSGKHLSTGQAYRKPSSEMEAVGTRRTARTRSTDFPQHRNSVQPMSTARKAFTGAITLGAMLLRDPRKMQAVTSAVTAAAAYIQSRRTRRPVKHQTHAVRVK